MSKRALKPTETGMVVAEPYEPTPREHEGIEAYRARWKEQRPAPRMKVTEKKDGAEILPDHPDIAVGHTLLMEAIGTAELDFLDGLLKQLTNVGTHGQKVDEQGLNFMLAVVKGVEPKDQVEAMLAAQMAAVHNATMTFARRLAHVDNIAQRQRRARIQQARADLRVTGRGAQAIPDWGRAEGHGGARHGERGRASHRRQRLARGEGRQE